MAERNACVSGDEKHHEEISNSNTGERERKNRRNANKKMNDTAKYKDMTLDRREEECGIFHEVPMSTHSK